MKRKPDREVGDNGLALSVILFSGILALIALYQGVSDDRAKTALAVGANGMTGVLGFIGGKNRRALDEKDDDLKLEAKDLMVSVDAQDDPTTQELLDRVTYLETQLEELVGPLS